ncbi:MAG: hypothetical protein KAT34_15085 [Candidatus Aminicenantes bacterium]|nr:hypothetical protein [Candidatus Aminicenantes bacterium]
MKNCLIMGSGRSGTSMLGGILYQAGYFMGETLHKPRDSNPKGFFEWYEINRINEDILSNYGKSLRSTLEKKIFKRNPVTNPGGNQRWLLSLPTNTKVTNANPQVQERIKKVVKREPFCYKDPRFSYTLPVWRPYLKPGTVFICIFREPGAAVESILKECRRMPYLASLRINRQSAFRVWRDIYAHILFGNSDNLTNFFFVHYNQVYNGTAIGPLAGFLEADLKGDFVDQNLKRSAADYPAPAGVKRIYEKLCQLAGYTHD